MPFDYFTQRARLKNKATFTAIMGRVGRTLVRVIYPIPVCTTVGVFVANIFSLMAAR